MKIWDHCIAIAHDTTFLKISKKSKFTIFLKTNYKNFLKISKKQICTYLWNGNRKSETEQIVDPNRVTACKITIFEVFGFAVFWLVNINLPLSQKP